MNRFILTLIEHQAQKRYKIIYDNYSPQQSLFLKLIYIANVCLSLKFNIEKKKEKYKSKVGLRFHRREDNIFCVLALWYTGGMASKIYKGGTSGLVFLATPSLLVGRYAIKQRACLPRPDMHSS